MSKTRRPARRRVLLLTLAVIGLATLVPLASLTAALAAPGNTTATERAVEWIRGHGGGGMVNIAENWWFSNNAPKQGGQPDHGITFNPAPGSAASPSGKTPATTPRPVDITTPAGQSLPNEGIWQPVGPTVAGAHAMYATQVRPDSVHTSLLDGLVWMDPKLVRFDLHPGLQEPGGTWQTPPQVPSGQRLDLLAAFNGGFRMQDANGGFYLEGHAQKPLRDGAASIVINRDGTATVGQWNRDVSMTPDVVAVRQNLQLIVDNGQPVAGLDDNKDGQWGSTLGNRVLVWRSAVCVDGNGGVIYGYGNGLGAQSLANLMQRAGCQRAMELDINPSWTTFNLYGPTTPGDPGSVTGTKLLPDQNKGGSRYLSDDSRDFIAVLARNSSP
jgi:hypothetical protein